MVKFKSLFFRKKPSDVLLEDIKQVEKDLSAIESLMGDDEDDYDAQRIRRRLGTLVNDVEALSKAKKPRRIGRLSRDDTYLKEQSAVRDELEELRETIARTSLARQSSELATTILKKRPPRSPVRFWTLNFRTFNVPGYLDPWKLLSYDPVEFMRWWMKAREDSSAEMTDGWVDIRFFARKVFHLIMYLQAEAVKQSVFFKHIETMAEKAKQIARVIALLYGVSDAYDSQIQAIFECCPPVIYILKRAFEGCVNTVESPDENEEVANGLSDLDLMSIDPLLTEIANRLFILQERTPLTRGRDIIKPNLLENIYESSDSKRPIAPENTFRVFYFTRRAQELMLKENLAENRKELDAVARGLQMAENTRYMLSSLRPESPNTSDESVFDVTYLRNMKIEEINFQFSSAVYCGEGSFGQVLKVKSTDGNEYAVKIFKQGRRLKKRFLEEVKVWSQLDDDFILRLRGFCVVDFSPLPGLVAELCQGSLKDLVVSNQRNTGGDGLSAMQRLEFLRDINYGLRYLHLRSIAHGDLRAANVLITFPTEDNGGQPKAILCDFGISKSEMEVVEDIAAHVIAGKRLSEAWRSPEIVSWYREKNQIRVSSEGDMYSYGCVFLEVAYDREPFKDVNSPGDMLLKGKLPAECDDITGLKTAHWSFMKSLWAFDPSKRLDVNAANVEINELIEWNDSS